MNLIIPNKSPTIETKIIDMTKVGKVNGIGSKATKGFIIIEIAKPIVESINPAANPAIIPV